MNNTANRIKNTASIKQQKLRKQLALFILTVVVLFISCAFFGNILTSAKDKNDNSLKEDCYTSIAIQHGDTLWSIAETYMPEDYSSVQDYVKHLKKINNLKSDDLQAGKYLIVTYEHNFKSAKSTP